MDTTAKSQMTIFLAPDINLVWIREDFFVTIARAKDQHDAVTFLDLLTSDHGVLQAGSPHHLNWRQCTEKLFTGHGDQLGIFTKFALILNVICEVPQTGSNGPCRSIESCQEKQITIAKKFVAGQWTPIQLSLAEIVHQGLIFTWIFPFIEKVPEVCKDISACLLSNFRFFYPLINNVIDPFIELWPVTFWIAS
ncbi:hypothetical protein BGP82_02310 [Pseudomonas putida]|uniref:Uncharacterized protein n=1 Tax=Pseudomonas putida TaxID=303 RepID=A0A2S3XCP2_PSEPU|nr:hypothetical protein BGP82_02310 [Pseudomonas putida]